MSQSTTAKRNKFLPWQSLKSVKRFEVWNTFTTKLVFLLATVQNDFSSLELEVFSYTFPCFSFKSVKSWQLIFLHMFYFQSHWPTTRKFADRESLFFLFLSLVEKRFHNFFNSKAKSNWVESFHDFFPVVCIDDSKKMSLIH